MTDQPTLLDALRTVAEYAAQTYTTENATVHEWCQRHASLVEADHAVITEIGRRLYEQVETNPGDQEYFEMGALARYLCDQDPTALVPPAAADDGADR